jgi:hypothetical protein
MFVSQYVKELLSSSHLAAKELRTHLLLRDSEFVADVKVANL